MSDTLDRRQERTRQAILDAFTGLLFEQGYGRITMAAVADRANVGRSTLYEHFRTKADLLSQGVAPLFAVIAGCVAPEPSARLLDILRHVRENQAAGRLLFLPPTRGALLKALSGAIAARDDWTPGPLPRGLIADQIAVALFAILEPWVIGQAALSAETVAQAMHRSGRALAIAQET